MILLCAVLSRYQSHKLYFASSWTVLEFVGFGQLKPTNEVYQPSHSNFAEVAKKYNSIEATWTIVFNKILFQEYVMASISTFRNVESLNTAKIILNTIPTTQNTK